MRIFIGLLFAGFIIGCAHSEAPPKKAAEQEDKDTEPDTTAPPGAPPAPAPGETATPAIKPPPVKIKIIVRSNPPKSKVFWGKKNLGETPVTLERPRDSGPVDLIIRNDGYLPLHARAYTFRNDAFTVRLTKVEDRMNLFGAKREANEPTDGGAPPAQPPPPP